MGNSYFQFRQFRIEQSRCAMKVSTDACIQGAWTPIHHHVKRVLDIGTGTGLLSLMLAQRNEHILIDAIELDEPAARQAAENFAASPWSARLTCIQGDARTYAFHDKYDLIICNPPFFKNSLLGGDNQRNQARHTTHFSLEDLMHILTANLQEDGYASVLLPVSEQEEWARILYRNEHYISKLHIQPSIDKPANRVITLSSKNKFSTPGKNLPIRDIAGTYSTEFALLLQPYYLNI